MQWQDPEAELRGPALVAALRGGGAASHGSSRPSENSAPSPLHFFQEEYVTVQDSGRNNEHVGHVQLAIDVNGHGRPMYYWRRDASAKRG